MNKDTTKIEVQATYESNLAPLWLVFPEHIINTQNIICIRCDEDAITKERILIIEASDRKYKICLSDFDTAWKALQKVFTEGVPKTESPDHELV